MANAPTADTLITRAARRSRKALPSLELYLSAAVQAHFPDEHIEVVTQLIEEMKALVPLECEKFELPKRIPGPVPAHRAKTSDYTRAIFLAAVPKKPRKKRSVIPKVIAKITMEDFTQKRQLEASEVVTVTDEGSLITFDLVGLSA